MRCLNSKNQKIRVRISEIFRLYHRFGYISPCTKKFKVGKYLFPNEEVLTVVHSYFTELSKSYYEDWIMDLEEILLTNIFLLNIKIHFYDQAETLLTTHLNWQNEMLNERTY